MTPVKELIEGFPSEFGQYLQYVRDLGFEENPDYDYLRGLFDGVLKKEGSTDDGQYDWMYINNGKGWEASVKHASAGPTGGAYGHSPGFIPPSNQEVRHAQPPPANRPNQHLSASRLNAPQPPPPSPALVRHGSKQQGERRQNSGANRDPRRQSAGQHLASQPSTPGTSANQLPSQGQIRMSQTPLQQNQTAANQPIRASPDRKKKGFMASLLSCCGG